MGFHRLKSKLSLAFHRNTIVSHMYQKPLAGSVVDSYGTRKSYEGGERRWAEAKSVGEGFYVVTQKELSVHNNPLVTGNNDFAEQSISSEFGGQKTTLFTKEQAVRVLKDLERDWEKDGYSAGTTQPYKRHRYTKKM